MGKKTILIGTLVVALLTGTALAHGMGFGGGMMGFHGVVDTFRGMMHNWYSNAQSPYKEQVQGYGLRYPHGMMGYGFDGYHCPMMAGWYDGINRGIIKEAEPITIEEAKKIAEDYVEEYNNLKLDEVYEFQTHFEAEFEEKDTGKHAFEIVVDKYTGAISPEMGPNMMWNTKYGHFSTDYLVPMSITEEKAREIVQEFINRNNLDWNLDNAEVYYGFYEFHAKDKNKSIVAQINVNGYTGALWIENWHGPVINELNG
ncbi:MAG: PepSY domain-containing protein [Candidatus Hydrothermarchaeota archaeon]